MTNLSVIIVSYRSSAVLPACLKSVFCSWFEGSIEVLIVNNDPSDDAWLSLAQRFPQVQWIQAGENRGFAAGVNQGIQAAQGRVLLLLNPDVELHPSAVAGLVEALRNNPEVGIVGPRILNPDGSVQSRVQPKRLPTLFGIFCELFYLDKLFPNHSVLNAYFGARFNYGREQEVEQVCGACLAIGREVIGKIGLMDERFFLYFEETDWCLRATAAGYKILYVPAAVIHHQEGHSTKKDWRTNVWRFFDSEIYFFRKHYGLRQALVLYALNVCGFLFRLSLILPYWFKDRSGSKSLRQWWALLYHLDLRHLIRLLHT